jgi:hypothetical protein
MNVPMKVLTYDDLVRLNDSSISAGRNQNLKPEAMPRDTGRLYTVNFQFDHDWNGQKDKRLSVILQPGVRTAWLDISVEEFNAIPDTILTELEWEAAVCVGIPPWVK